MAANKTIIISVLAYIVLFVVSALIFFNTKFTGNDAAGNGMARGLSFFYGLGILFIIALVLTLINTFSYKSISLIWVKFLFFVPLVLPLFVFGVEFLEIGKSRSPSIDGQAHRLTVQIRATKKLENPRFAFRSSKGGSFSKLNLKEKQNDFYLYENSNAIFFGSDRKFHISSTQFETPEQYLEIPYKPKPVPYTDWKDFFNIGISKKNTVELEFRYSITKSSSQQSY